MSLAAPFWLLAGGLALLVVLLHALRHERIEVPSLILWRKLATTGRAHSALRPPRWSLLLVLQLLAVLAIALALAQPIFGANAGRTLHEIFVLDASAGMRATDVAPNRFEAARAQLIGELPNRGEGGRVSVAVGGGDPQLLFARQEDGEALVDTVRGLSAGDGTADWSGLAGKLAGIVRADEDTRVVVWTSGQVDPAARIRAALPGVPVETRMVGDPLSANAGITGSVTPVADAPGKWVLRAQVALQAMTVPPEVTLRFQPAGGDGFLDWGRVTPQLAEDGQTARIEEGIELPSDGVLLLTLPADLQPADDSFGLVVRAAAPHLRALYAGAGNRPLQLALLARGDVDLFSAPSLPADAEAYDLVIADNVVLARKPATNLLWLGSARLESEAEPSAVTANPTGWSADHPLAENMHWSAVGSAAAFAGPALRGGTVLLAAAEGPLVAARTTASGREVRLGLGLDPAGWAGTPEFPIFISNLLDWIAADPVAVCIEGERCTVPARLVGQPIIDDNGTVVAGAASGEWLLDEANGFVPHGAGLYTIGSGPTRTIRIVNAAPAEPGPATPAGDEPQTLTAWLVPGATWLMLVAAVLLVAEAILAGRGPERFLRREGLAGGLPGVRKRRWALGLRGVALLLVAAAIVAIPLLLPRQGSDTVLVIEPQAGGDPRRAELIAEAENPACAGLPLPSLGLVGLTSVPYVASDLSCGTEEPAVASDPSPAADIGAAVELAAAMLRPGSSGRIVLSSDGSDTGERLDTALASLRARGVGIDVLPLTDRPADDTIVTGVEAPGRPVEGDRLPLKVMIDSEAGGTVRLGITSDGVRVDEIEVTLKPGSNVVDVSLPEVTAGGHAIEVALLGAADAVPQNDRSGLTLAVAPKALVAVVAPELEWGGYFARALALQGIASEVMQPGDAPSDPKGWLKYSAVALMNVPAIALTSTQQDQLEHYVRVDGRGLLILGGENSFGPGGYYQTPLEAMSPLSARVPKDMPVTAFGFVLDRSGSMKADVEGVTQLAIAKSATLSAVELLNDASRVAIVVFDTKATLLVPMQDRKDIPAIEEALKRVAPGGGTSIFPGLSKMLDEMEKSRSRVRHIVVMSDGQSQGGDFLTLARDAHNRGITISAIAIGTFADVARLRDLARDGGGAFHVTQDFRALPSILSQEAMMLSGDAMEAGVRPVTWVDRDVPFLNGLPERMPEIESYVPTTAKPEARLHLATTDDKGETVPILASWQYGNGAVLALATHGAGPGSVRWMALPEYPMLWSQIVRNMLPTTSGPGMTVALERSGGQGVIVADVLSDDGEPVGALAPVATILRDGQPVGDPLRLQMVVPGRYTARFAADVPGTYTADVAADGYAATSAMSVAYAPRLDFTRARPERLEALAAASGGQVLAGTEPLARSSLVWQLQPVWRPWLLLALAVLLVDLAVRYVPGRFPFLRDTAPRRPSRLASETPAPEPTVGAQRELLNT